MDFAVRKKQHIHGWQTHHSCRLEAPQARRRGPFSEDAALIGRRYSGREALQRSLNSAVLPLTLFCGPCGSPLVRGCMGVVLTDTSDFWGLEWQFVISIPGCCIRCSYRRKTLGACALKFNSLLPDETAYHTNQKRDNATAIKAPSPNELDLDLH